MQATLLSAFESQTHPYEEALKRTLKQKGMDTVSFHLPSLTIRPCIGCNVCSIKDPGVCVLKDDMIGIHRSMAKSALWIFLTPIRFGGYSAVMKRACDRMMPLGTGLYKAENGELLHPARYGPKTLWGVGACEQGLHGEAENFRLIIERNAFNLNCKHFSAVLKPAEDAEALIAHFAPALQEV